MNKFYWGLLLAMIIAALGFFLSQERGTEDVQSTILAEPMLPVLEDFSRAVEIKTLIFPQDYGPHPDFQTEWWYYTGNLQSEDGSRFGYQLTFFRRALLPTEHIADRASSWATTQVYMAHFALSDISSQNFHAFERLSRGAAELSGAQAQPFQVWLRDWSVTQIGINELGFPVYKLYAAEAGIELDLFLDDQKGPILQGDQGYSPKGPEPGQASYYYSLTRLKSTGNVKVGGKFFEVNGYSWMDHEFSTSVLSKDQIGWDWFSIQLDDGSEIMMFQIRKADGSIDPFSSGAWISSAGKTTKLTQQDFQISVNKTWRSPHSNTTYPSGWEITIPSLELSVNVDPLMPDQELNLSYSYWEGAVKINGARGSQAISGFGYTELTGYAVSMGGEF